MIAAPCPRVLKIPAIFQLHKPAGFYAMYGLFKLTLVVFFLQYSPSQLTLSRLAGCSPFFCGDMVPPVSWLGAIWCKNHLHCTMWVQSVLLSFIKLQQISWFHPNVLWSILKPINYFSDALLSSVYVWVSLHISAGKGHKMFTQMCVCSILLVQSKIMEIFILLKYDHSTFKKFSPLHCFCFSFLIFFQVKC